MCRTPPSSYVKKLHNQKGGKRKKKKQKKVYCAGGRRNGPNKTKKGESGAIRIRETSTQGEMTIKSNKHQRIRDVRPKSNVKYTQSGSKRDRGKKQKKKGRTQKKQTSIQRKTRKGAGENSGRESRGTPKTKLKKNKGKNHPEKKSPQH